MTTTETQPTTPAGYDAEQFAEWTEATAEIREGVEIAAFTERSDFTAFGSTRGLALVWSHYGCCPRCGSKFVSADDGERDSWECDECRLQFGALPTWHG
jgi:predicted  nucleic acid-binding Zn ribbon protein